MIQKRQKMAIFALIWLIFALIWLIFALIWLILQTQSQIINYFLYVIMYDFVWADQKEK